MKTGLTLKFMLGATLACVLLTLLEIFVDRITPLDQFTHRDFEMIAAWIVLLIAWGIYFLEHFRRHKQDKEESQ